MPFSVHLVFLVTALNAVIEWGWGHSRSTSAADTELPAAWQNNKHHLSFDNDVMMMEKNPEQAAFQRYEVLAVPPKRDIYSSNLHKHIKVSYTYYR